MLSHGRRHGDSRGTGVAHRCAMEHMHVGFGDLRLLMTPPKCLGVFPSLGLEFIPSLPCCKHRTGKSHFS